MACQCVKAIVAMRMLTEELGLKQHAPTPMSLDAKAVIDGTTMDRVLRLALISPCKGLISFVISLGKGRNFAKISKFLARAYAHLNSALLSLYLPHALSFSKRGPALRAVVADHHGPLDVVGEGHVLVGSEECLEERKHALRCCRARRERKHDQRGLGPSTNLATVVTTQGRSR